MNTNNYTIKSQEALQNAVQLAQSKGQQAIETGHLLKAVINVGENVTHFIFNKLGVNSHNLLSALDRIIDSYPRVSGGEVYLSPDSNKALEKATRLAKDMGDQYISLEHILLGLLDNRDQVAQLLKDSGLTEKETKEAIKNEANNGLKNTRGTLAMARTQAPHSATAQFFINVADNSFLNFTSPTMQGWGYAVFGKVIRGQDVVNQIAAVKTGSRGYYEDVPMQPVIIKRATIVE